MHVVPCYFHIPPRVEALRAPSSSAQVVTQTISRDLDDINGKVRTAAMELRRERVTLIKQKVKDVLGKDVDVKVSDINTDVKVSLNTNDVARTAGIELNELTLTEEEVRMLEELNGDEELAAPPSSEEVFGEKVGFLAAFYKLHNLCSTAVKLCIHFFLVTLTIATNDKNSI